MSDKAKKRLNKIMRERNRMVKQILAGGNGPLRKSTIAAARELATETIVRADQRASYQKPNPFDELTTALGLLGMPTRKDSRNV